MQSIKHRKPHIMGKHKTTQHPCNFMFFDTETKDSYKGKEKGIQHHRLWFGWVWAFRYEDQKVTRSFKRRFTTPDEFYDLIRERLDANRPLYVIAHNLTFDLTQVDFWCKAEEKGLECKYCVLEDPPLFMSYGWDDCKIVFLDTFNFWKCSVSDMGKSLSIEKLPMPDLKASEAVWNKYCFRDVEILANQLTNLLDFLTEYDLGSFGISAPALAMNSFKHRFMKHDIFLHDRNQVLGLERGCYYGGLVNNMFVGEVKGKTVHHTDVNSLYPSVMLGSFPTKLLGSYSDIKVTDKILDRDDVGMCGYVRINSRDTCYPMRYNKRLCEVTGTFDTFLCGIELSKAISLGHVKAIHRLAIYEMQPVFKEFIEFFWGKRQQFKKQGDRVKEQLVKLLMNSLYGKFGMKGFNWLDFSVDNLKVYYEMHGGVMPDCYDKEDWQPLLNNFTSAHHFLDLDRPAKLRYLSGKLQIQIPTGEHSESFCAIAAFVTSYARERLRNLISIAGYRNTYYCDTDSLFISDMGLHNLKAAGEVSETELGKLKIEGKAKNPIFYGPKDYEFNDKKVLKGIRKNAVHIKGTTYEQDQFEGLKSVLNRGGERYIEIKRIRKTNKREYNKGMILPNGWTIPYRLSE